jgi:soluble lytic murein transglycosylase-like protein
MTRATCSAVFVRVSLRERNRGLASRPVRARNKRRFVYAVTAALACLAAVNLAVRATGGAPNILSPLRVPEKLEALGRLAWHHARHAVSGCDADVPALLRESSRRHGVPAALARAVAETESGLGPHRISSAGAMGVMQLMPGTAAELGVGDPFDARESVDAGVRYLAKLRRRYDGDRTRVLAAYNAGPGAVSRSGPMFLADETRAYVRGVRRQEALHATASAERRAD